MAVRFLSFPLLAITLLLVARQTEPHSTTMNRIATKRVNILFLMADQLRQDALGCYGNQVAMTPNMDWLATQGVRFTNTYTSTPSCTPARAAILTGLSPWYHGMLGYGDVAPRYPFEMPRALSEAGYYTYSIGKDHFGWNSTSGRGISHGFHGTDLYDGLTEEMDDYDQWFAALNPGVDPLATGLDWNDHRGAVYALPEYYHPTSYVGRKAVKFLETYNQDEPFFLKVSFHRPHSPYDPPGRFMNMFRPDKMPLPYLGDGWDVDCDFPGDPTLPVDLCCGHVDPKTTAISRQAYYANVAFVDEWIGKIFETMQNRSLFDNTFILFTSDHGDMLGDHYRWRKILPYESSAKIPMILLWPPSMAVATGGVVSTKPGTVASEVVELRDIFPTFLDVAGELLPFSLNGSSLLSLLAEKGIGKDAPTKWRGYIDLEHSPACNKTFHWNGYSDGKTKYIFRAYFADEQLFDLTSDPHEMHNLAEDPAWQDTLKTWRERLVEQFEREQRGPEWVKDGVLQRRVKGQVYSPHYPEKDKVGQCPRSVQYLNEQECAWLRK